MLKCYICGKEKPEADFYICRSRSSGRSYWCKECERGIKASQRSRHNEVYRRKDRKYYKQHRKEILRKRKETYKKDRFKFKAREMVKTALLKGELTRPKFCENYKKGECTDIIQAHHDDYSKPLEVRWLCGKCHMRFHHGKG